MSDEFGARQTYRSSFNGAAFSREHGTALGDFSNVTPFRRKLGRFPQKTCQVCSQPIFLDATACKFCGLTVNSEKEVTDQLGAFFKKSFEEQRECAVIRRVRQSLHAAAVDAVERVWLIAVGFGTVVLFVCLFLLVTQ